MSIYGEKDSLNFCILSFYIAPSLGFDIFSPFFLYLEITYSVKDDVIFDRVFGCFRLFIVATGCPSERRPQKTVSCYGG